MSRAMHKTDFAHQNAAHITRIEMRSQIVI